VVSRASRLGLSGEKPSTYDLPSMSMRIGIVMNMIAPYTTPVFERLAARPGCDIFVVYETPMEPSRRWQPKVDLPYGHTVLRSWTFDLARLAVGAGFKTREDTYLYVPRRPLAALSRFAPDAVVAAGGGIWSSPANIAVLAARARHNWAFVPWWGSFRRDSQTVPRRLAEPWVKAFIRASDAWLAYGSRSSDELVRLGADATRIVVAPLVAMPPPGGAPRRETPPRNGMRFLFVGRLIERKGIDVLLDAFRAVEGGELWVVGDGPLAALVESAAAADERVRFFRHLEAGSLDDVYRKADVLVLPALYDVWGLVVNEAQEYGLPVITTDQVGAAADLIDPGVTGLIVPAGSVDAFAGAMRELGGWTREQRQRCGERTRAKFEQRSADRAAEAMFEGCSLAVEHRGRRSKTTLRA
jgi:glycosyltransferase involved in cell wall biosynthesis